MSAYDWIRRSDALTELARVHDMERRYPGINFRNSRGEPTSNAEWIHNPDYSQVAGIPAKYWKVVGNQVLPMVTGERDAVDAALLEQYRNEEAQRFSKVGDTQRAIVLLLLDQLNDRSTAFNALLSALQNATSLADLKSRVQLIDPLPTYDTAQVIQAVRNKMDT